MERVLKGQVLVLVLVLVALVGLSEAKEAPKVQVYSRYPVEFGTKNFLNCYVEGFHPPKINITLLKNGEPMPDVKYSDMSFSDNWTFQCLVSAPFIPREDDDYTCRVAHVTLPEPQTFKWDPEF
ncbi:beta-2-microglobulin [Dromaius novaehollandiae]|uniref:Beta-2-microglobulin n=1 Tax=Dromaius novaehollandiae TaxID=8790 RepID=A0A8C4PDT4_DRONO|nr:beta-2-microglobulin [Dromaius novaehollandiae]XP_025971923.1 beta-2-microglobulin [Dromaius novaehollandiae]